MDSFLVLAFLLTFGGASATQWSKGRVVEGHEPTSLRFSMVQNPNGIDALRHTLRRVSDPTSQSYGQYLTVEQVTELIAPSAADFHAVRRWLRSSFPSAHIEAAATRDHFFVSGITTSDVQRVFKVTLHAFKPAAQFSKVQRARRMVYRTASASHDDEPMRRLMSQLPAHIATLLHSVVGVADLPTIPTTRPARPSALSEPGMTITPPVIYERYQVPSTPPSGSSAAAGVAEFEQAYFYPTDLIAFEKKWHYQVQNATIIGPNDPDKGYLGEATLDVEYISAVGGAITTWDFSVNEFDMVKWANLVLSTPKAPMVHSVSWGSGESGYQSSQKTSWNTEFLKLGTMGYSILTASGDQATGSTGIFSCGKFDATFPATSPYVTAVGGTYITSQNGTETVWPMSGGGFSAFFKPESYQTDAISAYLKQGNLPSSQYWDNKGRAIPDVSALSTNYQVLTENALGTLSGTSAATPVFAAIITRLNTVRASKGEKPLGFLNPWLYKLSSVGSDIVAGANKNPSCPAGFPATTGWDACSGLGTPLYPTLLKQI